MAETVSLFPARTFLFPKLTDAIGFDVYLKLGPDKFTKVFPSGSIIDIQRLETYILKGTTHFYIPTASRSAFLTSALTIADGLLKDNKFNLEENQQLLDELAEQSLNEIFVKKSFDRNTEQLLAKTIGIYVDLIHQQNAVLPALIKLARQRKENIKHAVMTSIFSTLLAKAIEPKSLELAFNCGYAGFVHDIGMALIKNEYDEHNVHLKPHEQVELFKHPMLGAQLLSQSPGVPAEVRIAVMQHHEGYDGSGYPKKLTKDMISLPARIVAIAESFVSLVTGNESNFPLPPSLAVHALARNTKLDPYLYSTFAKLLKI